MQEPSTSLPEQPRRITLFSSRAVPNSSSSSPHGSSNGPKKACAEASHPLQAMPATEGDLPSPKRWHEDHLARAAAGGIKRLEQVRRIEELPHPRILKSHVPADMPGSPVVNRQVLGPTTLRTHHSHQGIQDLHVARTTSCRSTARRASCQQDHVASFSAIPGIRWFTLCATQRTTSHTLHVEG